MPSLRKYLREAHHFYDTIVGDDTLTQPLAARGVTAEVLSQAQADLQQLEALEQTQEAEKSEAQQATRTRNEARRAFADWLAEYQKFARVALNDQPDLLEQLGITVRSR